MSPSIDVITLREQSPAQAQLIDVRSASEFASGHIPGAVNIPMDQIEARLDDLHPTVPVVLICQTGKRARMTAGLLEPCQRQIAVLDGGTSAWIQAGLPVVSNVKTRWSLERQVRLGAGLLVLTGAGLALMVNRELALSICIRRARTHVCGAHRHLPDGGRFWRRCLGMGAANAAFEFQAGSPEGYRVSVDTARQRLSMTECRHESEDEDWSV